MNRVLHPTVFRYLRSVQQSPSVGLYGFFRRDRGSPQSSRTVYRWQRSLGDQLLIVPNVTVEAFGLRHAHVFVYRPAASWLSCPFGLEASWVTPDFCRDVLYVHCLAPDERTLIDWCAAQACDHYEVIWSASGWQQLLLGDEVLEVPVRTEEVVSDVLRRHPFVVPAVLELWVFPNSLPLAWARIHQRLGSRVKEFLPRTKVRYVNGKTHLTNAFRIVQQERLLRQQLVRYHPLLAVSVEVFLSAMLDRADLTVLLDGLRSVLHAVETYPTKEGYWCRLLGPHQLLDAIMRIPEGLRARLSRVHFHTKRQPAPLVRVQYETLFNPKTGLWTVTA